MFKDYHKYLKESLKVYTFLLVIIFIMKIVGLNYFGLDINNPIMIKINKIVWYFKIREIWYIFTLWLYAYFMISIVSNNKNVRANALIVTIIDVVLILTIKNIIGKYSIALCDSLLLYGGCLVASKGKIKKTTKRAIIVFLINMLFQFISMITRIGEFADNHPVGKYLITTNGHITACVDGYVVDTWDCTDKKIEYIWKIS